MNIQAEPDIKLEYLIKAAKLAVDYTDAELEKMTDDEIGTLGTWEHIQ